LEQLKNTLHALRFEPVPPSLTLLQRFNGEKNFFKVSGYFTYDDIFKLRICIHSYCVQWCW